MRHGSRCIICPRVGTSQLFLTRSRGAWGVRGQKHFVTAVVVLVLNTTQCTAGSGLYRLCVGCRYRPADRHGMAWCDTSAASILRSMFFRYGTRCKPKVYMGRFVGAATVCLVCDPESAKSFLECWKYPDHTWNADKLSSIILMV